MDHYESFKAKLAYSIEDAPPIHLCLFLGLQQFLTMFGGIIATPFIIAESACIGQDVVGRAHITGTLMFTSGLSTLIQICFGSRLPIIQGPSFAFIAPMFALQNMPRFQCPDFENLTNFTIGGEEHQAIWHSRIVEIQGAIMIAGALETVLGCIGVIGFILRAIGPLTIAPTIGLVGLSFADQIVSNYAAKYWPAAIMSLCLVAIFTLYLCNVPVPFVSISLENRKPKFSIIWPKLFGLFPVLLALAVSWLCFFLLTHYEVLPSHEQEYGYYARTDTYMDQFLATGWFRIPYPGQWGLPKVSLAVVIGMCAGIIASVVETIGDLCACARLCGAPSPPEHALNRGIMAEGISCILAGAFGCGPGVTSYSENIGAIAITRVASRRVFYVSAVLLLIFGCITKFGAFFALIPLPILGGVLIAMLSMVSAVGFSSLQFLDLNLTRNLFIFGLSMFLGIALPSWARNNADFIRTGVDILDQIFFILLTTGMLVGGVIGFVLDNTVPGATRKQRGIGVFANNLSSESKDSTCYDILFFNKFIERIRWARYLPISPTYDKNTWSKKKAVRVQPAVGEEEHPQNSSF